MAFYQDSLASTSTRASAFASELSRLCQVDVAFTWVRYQILAGDSQGKSCVKPAESQRTQKYKASSFFTFLSPILNLLASDTFPCSLLSPFKFRHQQSASPSSPPASTFTSNHGFAPRSTRPEPSGSIPIAWPRGRSQGQPVVSRCHELWQFLVGSSSLPEVSLQLLTCII